MVSLLLSFFVLVLLIQVFPTQSQVVSPSRGSGGRYFLSGGVSSSTRSIASAPAEGPRSPLDNPSNHNSSAHHNGDIGTGNGGSASHPNTSVERTGGGHGQQRSGKLTWAGKNQRPLYTCALLLYENVVTDSSIDYKCTIVMFQSTPPSHWINGYV